MFLKSLTIFKAKQIVREITFRKGINLIVDETPGTDKQSTGNNVGKTTVLKLIDFCLGASPKNIYIDPETKRDEYVLVRDFLISNGIIVKLILSKNLNDEKAEEIIIERNFLARKKILRRINGQDLTEDEFENRLLNLIFPNHYAEKPTFRQIISHNIRYTDENVNNTLKTLDKYTSDAEYETLYLFLFGCEFDQGHRKQEILEKLKQEDNYKKRLETLQTKTAYEAALGLVESEIKDLNNRKANLNLNKDFEADLDKLNNLKYLINKVSSEISKYNIRKELIIEAEQALNSSKAEIDLQQLHLIYQQATKQISGIQKTFNELVHYHNQMVVEKVKFIKKELPKLEKTIQDKNGYLKKLLSEENSLALIISKSDSFEGLEKLISELNERFRRKGEYENIIKQLTDVENNVKIYTNDLNAIDEKLFSGSFEQIVKNRLYEFNKHFSYISDKLYGEKYAIKHDIVTNKKNQRVYKFTTFNSNISSGKKQGEISCFDIAYILFADKENIPCLHFILNDKKELMHDNQLSKIAEFVNDNNIQFIASILKDKLPHELNDEENFILKLSQSNKLFKIENDNA
jgi:uncharacterized protein YydD (DUF2326 family)